MSNVKNGTSMVHKNLSDVHRAPFSRKTKKANGDGETKCAVVSVFSIRPTHTHKDCHETL